MGNTHSTPGTHPPHHNRLSKPKTNRNSSSSGSAPNSSPVSVSSRYAYLSTKEQRTAKTRLQVLSPEDRPSTQPSSRIGHEDVIELATHLQRRLSTASRSNSLSCFGSTRPSTASGDLHDALQIPSPTPSPVEPSAPQQKSSRRASLLSRSTSSLLRRRSLGTASSVTTRNSPVEGSRRTWNSWKTPKLNPEEEAKWATDKAGKSPLTGLAAFETPERTASPGPRAQTPGELEYSHLGSLKLGSLRVINGAASPAPSGRFGTDPSAFDDDYFSPVDPDDAPLTMKQTKRRGHGRSKSTLEPPTPPLYCRSLLADDIRRAKTTSRCDSPSRGHIRARPLFDDVEPEPVRRLRVMNKSADTLADALASQDAKELGADSRDTEQPDERVAVNEHESYRHEAVRLLHGTIFDEPASTEGPRPPEDDSLRDANASSHRPHAPRTDWPPPRKADSGYSSGGSLRTLQRETLEEDGTPACSEKAMVPADAPRSKSSSSNDAAEQTPPLSSPRASSSVSTTNQDVAFPPTCLQAPTNIAVSIPSHAAGARALEIDLPKSPVSLVSHCSVDSKSSVQRRLQKSRPSTQELPVVQSCEPILGGAVPAVPEDVRAKFVRRLSQTPGVECLTQTYPSKDDAEAQTSTDAPSAEIVSIRFPSPSPPTEPKPKASGAEREKPPRSGIRQSLSLFRSKSKTRNSEEEITRSRQKEKAIPAVVDLGDIAMSLGRSPYDAAMAPTRHQSMLSPTHPHQLGNAVPRTRSMITMDAQTAAEFARKRSRDLASLRPPMPQRPRSFHAHERRYDPDEDVPFVPSLLSAHAPKASMPPVSYVPDHVVPVALHRQRDVNSDSRIRARSTGRGPVVSELVCKYDGSGQFVQEPQVPDAWQPHARLWNQRRKSIGEGLRQHAGVAIAAPATPPMSPQYTGPGIRQLHSYASRRGRHLSHHRNAYSSHVPAFLERA